MPVLTAALSSLPVESVHVLPIGSLDALEASRGGSEKTRMCGCECGFGCEHRCFGCEHCECGFGCEHRCEHCEHCGFCSCG